jgi:hypothetical protein
MISRRLLKTEIDKVRFEYLELLYSIIKILERSVPEQAASTRSDAEAVEFGNGFDWHEFVGKTYGCLAEAPIARGDQGHYESREAME